MIGGRGKMRANAATRDYYLRMAQQTLAYHEDAARWEDNKATRALGIAGDKVTAETLAPLLAGYSLDWQKKLRQNAGKTSAVSLWDFPVSGNADFKAAVAVSDDRQRRELLRCEEVASAAALAVFDDKMKSRIGKGGRCPVPASAPVFTVREHTNRNGDCHPHRHIVVLNVALCPDGKWRSVHAYPLHWVMRDAGRAFQVVIRWALEHSRFRTIAGKECWQFRIDGVTREARDYVSSRRKEIERHMSRVGEYSRAAADNAAHQTRRPKVYGESLEESRKQWRKALSELGFASADIKRRRGLYPVDLAKRANKVAARYDDTARYLDKLKADTEKKTRGRPSYDERVARMRAAAEQLQRTRHEIRARRAARSIRSVIPLQVSDDKRQRTAYEVAAGGGIKIADVDRGTLRASVTALRDQGYRVYELSTERDKQRDSIGADDQLWVGAALARTKSTRERVASNLSPSVIAQHCTPTAVLRPWDPWKKQNPQAVLLNRRENLLAVDGKTVLVVTDAHCMSYAATTALLERAASRGAKVILVGDLEERSALRELAYKLPTVDAGHKRVEVKQCQSMSI